MPSTHFTRRVRSASPITTTTAPKLDLSHAMGSPFQSRDDDPPQKYSLRSQFDSDSEDDDYDDHDQTTSDSSEEDDSPTEDITMILLDVPEVVVTPPASREPSFFRASPDPALLDAEPWDFPATLSALLDPALAPSFYVAARTNFPFRQQLFKTLSLARKYGFPVPDPSILDSARSPHGASFPQQMTVHEEPTEHGPAAHHGPLMDGFYAERSKPNPANAPSPTPLANSTASIEFTIQAFTPVPMLPLPALIITPPADGDRPPPAPPSPVDPAFLDAAPWDFLAYRRALSQPNWAGTLEARALADPRLARQLAQAFVVARQAGIVLPTLEESRAAREEAEAKKRAMAEEWARTCSAATANIRYAPVPRRWKAVGQGRGRPLNKN